MHATAPATPSCPLAFHSRDDALFKAPRRDPTRAVPLWPARRTPGTESESAHVPHEKGASTVRGPCALAARASRFRSRERSHGVIAGLASPKVQPHVDASNPRQQLSRRACFSERVGNRDDEREVAAALDGDNRSARQVRGRSCVNRAQKLFRSEPAVCYRDALP
jgi:hypothetical protein